MAVIPGADTCVCTEHVGNNLYVAANNTDGSYICCYNIDKNLWEKLPGSFGSVNNLCTMGDHMYAISSDFTHVPQRYCFAKRQWQSVAQLDPIRDCPSGYGLSCCSYNGAVVLRSKLYIMYECKFIKYDYVHANGSRRATTTRRFLVYCFDEEQNQWEKKASTGRAGSHFGSSIFAVNNRLYIAGGCCDVDDSGVPKGETAAVEVYDEQNGEFSLVEQKHIPPNSLGAVEIEGRVYFIINKFPVDSGIRIPPGEVYPVCLSEWENIAKVGEDAALCYLPLKGNMRD